MKEYLRKLATSLGRGLLALDRGAATAEERSYLALATHRNNVALARWGGVYGLIFHIVTLPLDRALAVPAILAVMTPIHTAGMGRRAGIRRLD